MMSVTVPAGAVPGTVIQVQTPTGALLQVSVPQGVNPGMAFQVPIGPQPQVVQVNQQGGRRPAQSSNQGCCGGCGPPKTPVDKNFDSALKIKNQIDYNPRTWTDIPFLVIYIITLVSMMGICFAIFGSAECDITNLTSGSSCALGYAAKVQKCQTQRRLEMGGKEEHPLTVERHLAATVGVGWSMWNFLEHAPEIPATLIFLTFVVGAIWVSGRHQENKKTRSLFPSSPCSSTTLN